ncbi:uncharacterized protein LOC110239000 [Exaiptasia diaphana]|uniref:Uncharacterized protein n=1 Tax=Exaiptasia diaphana TaxID=2652724 RepID=A0A913X957_EXADI|nr:uncharacterized protein LOC110239000 [Exaiptasia diaphana]
MLLALKKRTAQEQALFQAKQDPLYWVIFIYTYTEMESHKGLLLLFLVVTMIEKTNASQFQDCSDYCRTSYFHCFLVECSGPGNEFKCKRCASVKVSCIRGCQRNEGLSKKTNQM